MNDEHDGDRAEGGRPAGTDPPTVNGSGNGAGNGNNNNGATPPHAFHWGFVILGVLMMIISLIVSALITEQSTELLYGNRAFMAIGGGLAAGGMLGFINVNLTMWKNHAIRGGGGFGIFLVLYFFDPPATVAEANQSEARKESIAEALTAGRDPAPSGAPHVIPHREIDAVLKQHGFSDVKEFRLTANEEEIQRVRRDLERIRD